ncbi:hypothetical protein SCHPADRAFT_616261 [Schizopora paradoxa]|uniref:F-box domain-containing protein n=1 Tax=Schizopora paradoxa TaxID=27342 RepID=A0A0H2R8R0_9AGAM|nr:hypothetical protein SCHPADRAFT_616261 [Schizopora paradoxa]
MITFAKDTHRPNWPVDFHKTFRPSESNKTTLPAKRQRLLVEDSPSSQSSSATHTLAQTLAADALHVVFELLFESPSPLLCAGRRDMESLALLLKATFPFNVLSVCRAWRRAALMDSKWWARLSLSLENIGMMDRAEESTRAYDMVGGWLEVCLSKMDRTPSMINGFMRFTLWLDPKYMKFALVPLLNRSEKWQDLEIIFGKNQLEMSSFEIYHAIGRPMPMDGRARALTMNIDLTQLKNLRKLRLNGKVWSCVVGSERVGRICATEFALGSDLPSLTSLTSLHLENMNPLTCVSLIQCAPHLEELYLCIDQHTIEWTPSAPISALRLRKFTLVMVGEMPRVGADLDQPPHPLLDNLRCDALEDLVVKFANESRPPVSFISDFVKANAFSLRALTLDFRAATDEDSNIYNYWRVVFILVHSPKLRVLNLLCSPPSNLLSSLYSDTSEAFETVHPLEENYDGNLTPALEELHVRGSWASLERFATLVTYRQKVKGITEVRKVTFEDCFAIDEEDPRRVEMLTSVALRAGPKGLQFLVDTGLQLIVSSSL